MATPRQTVADQIKADNPDFKVLAFPYAPKEVRDTLVAVWRTDVAPHPQSPNHLRHVLTISAYAGATLEEKAEAEVDDVLDAVLLSLQRTGVEFVSAERTVYADAFHGWNIKVNYDSENVYKSTVLSEGA